MATLWISKPCNTILLRSVALQLATHLELFIQVNGQEASFGFKLCLMT